jgi:hypothetical protein
MPILDFTKQTLKHYRWLTRRVKTSIQYGPNALNCAPRIFGNAMPKSGSHLLTQILSGLTALGPVVDPGYPPVNRSEGNRPLSPDAVLRNLLQMKPGDIRYGYIHAEDPFLSVLIQNNWATIFLYRDPRDMLVSHVFYATDMYEGHGMHSYYTEKLHSMEERLNAAIMGVTESGFELASVKERYDSYRGWLNQPGILCLKFEDLILDRESTLECLLDYIGSRGFTPNKPRNEALHSLLNSIAPQKSGTFRKGIPGNWREYFTDSNKSLFSQVAGDLLIDLGYEQNHNW